MYIKMREDMGEQDQRLIKYGEFGGDETFILFLQCA